TAEVVPVLETVAKGAPAAPQTRDAQAALGRVRKYLNVKKPMDAVLANKHGVFSLSCGPDGGTLAAVGLNEYSLWDIATGKERRLLNQFVAHAPDGKSRATVYADHYGASVRLLDSATGKEGRSLHGHHTIRVARFSP